MYLHRLLGDHAQLRYLVVTHAPARQRQHTLLAHRKLMQYSLPDGGTDNRRQTLVISEWGPRLAIVDDAGVQHRLLGRDVFKGMSVHAHLQDWKRLLVTGGTGQDNHFTITLVAGQSALVFLVAAIPHAGHQQVHRHYAGAEPLGLAIADLPSSMAAVTLMPSYSSRKACCPSLIIRESSTIGELCRLAAPGWGRRRRHPPPLVWRLTLTMVPVARSEVIKRTAPKLAARSLMSRKPGCCSESSTAPLKPTPLS